MKIVGVDLSRQLFVFTFLPRVERPCFYKVKMVAFRKISVKALAVEVGHRRHPHRNPAHSDNSPWIFLAAGTTSSGPRISRSVSCKLIGLLSLLDCPDLSDGIVDG